MVVAQAQRAATTLQSYTPTALGEKGAPLEPRSRPLLADRRHLQDNQLNFSDSPVPTPPLHRSATLSCGRPRTRPLLHALGVLEKTALPTSTASHRPKRKRPSGLNVAHLPSCRGCQSRRYSLCTPLRDDPYPCTAGFTKLQHRGRAWSPEGRQLGKEVVPLQGHPGKKLRDPHPAAHLQVLNLRRGR